MHNTIAAIAALTVLTGCGSAAPVRIVCLGDSITRGVRQGVSQGQTYEALLQNWLTTQVAPTDVVNVGIGGERTDQAIGRLAKDVVAKKPDIVTIMYGTNDSAVDKGESEPRLPLATYESNLRLIVDRLRAAGIKPVLMSSPPLGRQFAYTAWSPYRERGPNCFLIDYVKAARAVAADEAVGLVDNFAAWAEASFMGTDIDTLMTDGCHPNPAGHEFIARTMYPVLARLLGGEPTPPAPSEEAGAIGPAIVKPQPAPERRVEGNLAFGKPYTETSHNVFGYAQGLTDGIKDRDGRDGGYATGDDDTYPKLTTIDLGAPQEIGRILVHNTGEGNTRNIGLQVSLDGEQFEQVGQHEFAQGDGAVYECTFEPCQARYVRISFMDSWLTESHGSQHFMFLRELEVFAE